MAGETLVYDANNIYGELLTMDRNILASNLFTHGEMLVMAGKLEECRNIIAEIGEFCDKRLDR